MILKNRYLRIVAASMALLMLGSCAKQTNTDSTADTQPIYETTIVAEETKPTQQYTVEGLTQKGIAVERAQGYYLPLGEGKYVPADDALWQEYLSGQELDALENLSMPFVAVDRGDTALVYVLENPYRAKVRFTCDPDIQIELVAEDSTLDPSSQNNVRVYTTRNDAVAVAEAYRSYLEETGEILTLEQKAQKNANVTKLYGAPHIYMWGAFLLSQEDVKWQALIKATDSSAISHVSSVLADTEGGEEFADTLSAISGQDYVDQYQRNTLLRGLSEALLHEDFYDGKALAKSNDAIKDLLAKGVANLNPAERIELHKNALYENLPGVFEPVEGWYDYATVDVLNEMKAAGIDTAWIGLDSVTQAYNNPKIVETAVANGYLIGPYDSYHSIHEPGKEEWETAKFADSTLYENATVANENGEKISGFQNTGRKLNPTLSLPLVKERVQGILSTGMKFNSWFVDCDATGEVYDDYSPEHPTTRQQDVAARLERMDYIAQEYNMVVGSEGGNDFAANSIAFAHGIELPSFSWMDKDMSTNKQSEYYLGNYYSPTGGTPTVFAKTVPLKEKYSKLFLDMSYEIPLFKLVYNDSVITTYQWAWSTFKIDGESENRMLREVLYNVPPMYHLDRAEWDAYKDRIAAHHAVWSPFSQKAIELKMTAFEPLTADRLVQMTQYGDTLQVVANFSSAEYKYNSTTIPKRSALIIDAGSEQIYTP